jgi:hypothetical protein
LANGKRTWQVILQWHQGDTDKGGPPPIAFTIVGEHINLDLHRADPTPGREQYSIQKGSWPVATLDRGQWHDFAAEILWSQGEGAIKVWHRLSAAGGEFTPVTFDPQQPPDEPADPQRPDYPAQPTDVLTNLETLFPPQTNADPPTAYLKVGLYRAAEVTTPNGPYVLYHDEISRSEPILLRWPLPWPRPVLVLPRLRPPRWLPWPPPWPPFTRRRDRSAPT